MQTERKWIDLRSDTVTQPTQQMREAMFNAQVGDDVYGDDPTMNELEKKAAEMLGKEAALFMASGTMGNAVAVMSHTSRGDEIILSDTAHIVAHEVGGAAVLSQAFIRTLHFENGIFDAEQIRSAIRDRSNIHYPRTGLICVEEPLATGKVVPLDKLQAVYKMAKEEGLPVHMDGARIFNAATALGVDVKEIAACADSVMFCLSKGLCAPVGSMLVGSREYIERARRNRKTGRRHAPVRIFGGGRPDCAGGDDRGTTRRTTTTPIFWRSACSRCLGQPGHELGGDQHGVLQAGRAAAGDRHPAGEDAGTGRQDQRHRGRRVPLCHHQRHQPRGHRPGAGYF